ncbi:hypothetical protein [Halorubellus sp. PRR65]|uniref:hypothetical protein n=1 Tax=Halorubellus sp. PRR65 TaxID=3098148 RepID=UPI002B25C501|nr:hypothetical protein [Halorubellus sp. PRR65]
MERRKLLISIGALGAGGAAAFGTEAFTSIEAERSVDVSVAGDSSAYLAFQALDSDNAGDYVTTESDDTLAINLDGDGNAGGSGVNQDAITQVEDLFKIVNQGTQSTSVYFEDDSDAVTFRVTRSTDTSTNGSNGQSLEDADNSVELGVGEQVVIGLTIDTLNNDVSGSLLDTVTVVADATASAPNQNVPQPQYIVDGRGSEPNTFATLSDALRSGAIEQGSVVGIEGGQKIDESGENVNSAGSSQDRIDIETADVTITGFGSGTAQIDLGTRQTLKAVADGITLRNLKITEPGTAGRTIDLAGSNATADGLTVTSGSVTGGPHIQTNGADTTIKNCDVSNGPIAASGASGKLKLIGNSVDTVKTEGIFGFGNDSNLDVEAKRNIVTNHDTGGSGSSEIKFDTPPATINSETATQAQLEALLVDNTIYSARVNGTVGTKVTSQLSNFNSVQTAVDGASSGGVTLVESGSYTESISVSTNGLMVKGIDNPVIKGEGTSSGSSPHAAIQIKPSTVKTRIEGLTIRNPDGYYGIYVGSGSGSQDIDQNEVVGNTIEKVSTNVTNFSSPSPVAGGVAGVYVRGNHDNRVAVEDNLIQEVDTTGGSGVNAAGISLKSFTDDTAAKGASIQNNLIRNVAGSGRNKGISVNGDYDGAKVIGNTINYLKGDSNAAALKAITINQNKSAAPTPDPDGDSFNEWIGPVNFEVKKNEIDNVTGVSGNSWGIAVGNYEELDSTISNYSSGQSDYKGVENNNVLDTDLTVGIGRYNLAETKTKNGVPAGVEKGDTDTLVVDGNYYGDADGPTGKDVNGSLPGDTGAPVATVGADSQSERRVDVKNFSKSANSDAGSSL